MDKRKQRRIAKKQKEKKKEVENNPAYRYINFSKLEFPSIMRDKAMNDYGMVDDKLEKLYTEVCILEEQMSLKEQLLADAESGKTERYTPDGKRLMNIGELKTQARICDLTAWQSKLNIEKTIEDMMRFIGVETEPGKFMMTEEEHSDVSMSVVKRVAKTGIKLFKSNKNMLISKIKGA